jgi:hypothetical protein
MQGAFEAIFPREVNNEYRGSRIAFYGYLLLMAQQAFSGIVHYFTYDSGKVQIAGMIPFEGDPNPNALLFAFGADAGAWELVMLTLWGIVLWRYRSLIPLMFLLAIFKMLLGFGNLILHPISPEYFEHTPPALIVQTPAFALMVLMLFLSVRSPRGHASPPRTAGVSQ